MIARYECRKIAPPCLRHRGGLGEAMRLRPGRAAARVLPAASDPVAFQAFARFRKRCPRNWIWSPNSRANSCWRREAHWRDTPCSLAHHAAEGCLQGSISGQRDRVTRSWRKALCLDLPRAAHSLIRVMPFKKSSWQNLGGTPPSLCPRTQPRRVPVGLLETARVA